MTAPELGHKLAKLGFGKTLSLVMAIAAEKMQPKKGNSISALSLSLLGF
jgi:hypothetical protein